MAVVRIENFGGELPYISPRALPPDAAQENRNLHIIRGNATAETPIDLGADFPANTNADAYELSLFAPPTGECHWQVHRLNTPFVATGFLPSTEIPIATQLLCHQLWRCNNATALAVGLDVCGIYMETDH